MVCRTQLDKSGMAFQAWSWVASGLIGRSPDKGEGADIRGSALLSMWVRYYCGNLLEHTMSGKDGPSMNNTPVAWS